jgi:acetaldehyde dehydrogenase (acetylating)
MIKVAIIGTGNIGTDLLIKLSKLNFVKVVAFVGRHEKELPIDNVVFSKEGIDFFIQNPKCCDVVFECTNAYSAHEHWEIFREQGIYVIDMTPSDIGHMCIPYVDFPNSQNINMVTCGGQASIPLLKYFSSRCHIRYAEVVTQISSDSAGPATRLNIDKYIETTEHAIKKFTNIQDCKVILNINPNPKIVMQTTVFVQTSGGNIEDFEHFIRVIKVYIPKYEVVSGPKYIDSTTLMTSVKVLGSGEFFSTYAGNLDIINCAAIEALKNMTRKMFPNVYNTVLDI